MTPTITIELIGSYIAVHHESGTAADLTAKRNRGTTKSPIPVLCRMLIKAGHDPEARVHIIRKALSGDRMIPVFKRDRMLVIWAGVDIIDTVAKGPREVKHKPFPDRLGSSSDAVEAENAQEGAGGHDGPSDDAERVNAAYRTSKNAALVAAEVA